MKHKSIQHCVSLIMTLVVLYLITMQVFAANTSVLDGTVTITNNNGTISSSSTNSYVIQAEGGLVGCETVTLTITNASGSTATLAFDYSVSGNYGSFQVAGSDASTTGSYSGMLDDGASMNVVVAGKWSWGAGKATLTLSNFSLTVAAASSNITFNYDSTLGIITVGGSAVASGTTQEVPLEDGAALVATPNSGTTFVGWVDEADNSLLSAEASYTLKPAADMAVKAVFMGESSSGIYALGNATQYSESMGLLGMGGTLYYYTINSYTHLFDDLNKAATTAANGTSKCIIPLNDATLSAGDYTIPAGVTLLIPFDDSNTLYTTQAQSSDNYKKPTAYRTLTLESGAKLTVNGAVSVSGKHRYAQGSNDVNMHGGAPTGEVGFVNMESGSSVEVKDGGALYVYGFITGNGTVAAKSGSTVYENFQITDFRGGDQSTKMKNGVFPISQYYVQNIEVPLTVYSGATEYGYTTIYASGGVYGSGANFIGTSGSDAMFQLKSGYVTKQYDGSTDRLHVDVYGEITISSISLKLSSTSINSAEYVLPINGNITIKMASGSTATINQDLAMIPGSELIVDQNATITLGSGKSVYVYAADAWGENYCHGPRAFAAVPYAPSRTHTRTTADLVDASILVNGTLDASAGSFYTTSSGANIHSTAANPGTVTINPGAETVTYQCVNNKDYAEISITSAQLKNGPMASEEYTQTGTAGTYTYCGECQTWQYHDDAYVAAVAHIINSTGKYAGHFGTLKAAVEAYNADTYTGGRYIQMCDTSTEGCTISGTVYLDLNGQTVSNVEIAEGGTLFGADTTGNGYVNPPTGSIQLSGTPSTVAHVNDRNYVSIQNEDGTWSFWRCEAQLDTFHYYFKDGGHAHLAVDVKLLGHSTVLGKIQDIGFAALNSDGTAAKERWYLTDNTEVTALALDGKDTVTCILLDYGSGDADIATSFNILARLDFKGDHSKALITSDPANATSLQAVMDKANSGT